MSQLPKRNKNGGLQSYLITLIGRMSRLGRENERVPASSRAYLEHLGFKTSPESEGDPKLTETEKVLAQLCDSKVVIKDEPGRDAPPRPRHGHDTCSITLTF